MASVLIVGGLDLDTCDIELAAMQQTHVGTATLGTTAMETVVLKDLTAVQTLALWCISRKAAEMWLFLNA